MSFLKFIIKVIKISSFLIYFLYSFYATIIIIGCRHGNAFVTTYQWFYKVTIVYIVDFYLFRLLH